MKFLVEQKREDDITRELKSEFDVPNGIGE